MEIEDIKIAVVGNVDSGKCLARGTLIMLHNGSTKIVEEIQVNDLLMGDDSNPRRVLCTSRGEGQLYNIIPQRGIQYTVNGNHILSLKVDNWDCVRWDRSRKRWMVRWLEFNKICYKYFNTRRLKINKREAYKKAKDYLLKRSIINISVNEYIALPVHFKNLYKGYKIGVEFPYKYVHIDPYILGYWLENDDMCSQGISTLYKYNSRDVRLRLLAGLIDSDGYYKNGSFEWVQKNERLFDDVLWLFNSLGFAGYKKHIIRYYVNDGMKIPYKCFIMNIVGDLNEIPTKVVCIDKRKSPNDWLTMAIKVQTAYYGEYFGFELDGNQQFLLSDFTVTHNSTLIGTLLRGKNDNGRGSNRELVMNYRHEKETGQTSSVGYQILGFRKDGSIIYVENKSRRETWPKIMKETSKLISFMDLAGHEKYLKTTIHGMSSNHPDYALILIEGRGIRGMTREHIMLALSFSVPFIIVITKIDLYTKEAVSATVAQIGKIIKNAKKEIWLVRESVDLEVPLQQPVEKFVPIFLLSNVTGEGVDMFKEYLRRLPKRIDYSSLRDEPFELAVIEGFIVPGIGTVAHGFLARGTIRVGDQVWVGPDSVGNYHRTRIRTIHFKRLNVDFMLPGHHVCISLPGVNRKLLREGVYILHEDVTHQLAVRKFTADIKVLTSYPITIKRGYCPILNMDNIRMAARVLNITTIPKEGSSEETESQEYLCGGSRARIQFRFIYRPAYIRPGTTFVFREGRTRGFGKVLSIDLDMANRSVSQRKRRLSTKSEADTSKNDGIDNTKIEK